jgi:hypothetical protein
LERRAGRIRITSEGPGAGEDSLPEIVEDAARREIPATALNEGGEEIPPTPLNKGGKDFRILGRVLGYHRWTRQPREVLETHLRDRKAGRESDVRFLFEADRLESLEGIDLESKPDSFRERMLWASFPDSGVFRKARPQAVRVINEDPEMLGDETVATDVLFSTGHLDLAGVERRLDDLRETVRRKGDAVHRLEDRLVTREAYIEGMRPLTRLGEESVSELAREATSRLEAIRLHLGDRPEDEARREILAQASPDPDLVREIHRTVTTEFTALYPTRPLSVPTTGPSSATPMRFDASVYRVGDRGSGVRDRGLGVGGQWKRDT